MLELSTLGGFKIKYKNVELNYDDFNSEALTKLMVYMILKRESPVDSEAVAADLWAENSSKNPAGALKNLFYRLRNLLKEYFPDTEFFISKRGYYKWNSEIECVVDTEKLAAYAISAFSPEVDEEKQLFFLKKALDLFKGDFLNECEETNWIMVLRSYYHGIFLSVAKKQCEIYFNKGMNNELFKACSKVIGIDRLDEHFHYYMVMTYINSGDIKTGIETYENASRVLKKELGVTKLELLDKAYERLIELDNVGYCKNIRTLKQEFLEDSRDDGPFFCGYQVFKELYIANSRRRSEEDYSGVLLMLSLDFGFNPESGKMERFRAEKVINALGESLRASLRRYDIVTKYSKYQYVAMINDCKLNDVTDLVGRIDDYFEENYPQYSEARIKCQIEKID